MHVTYFGANSWLLDLGHTRILVDPWLVGEFVFGNASWLFKGKHRQPPNIPDRIDLILLSQGLEDHAHRPTLEQLDHSIPVVASPSGAKVVQGLGYLQVVSLPPGQVYTFSDRVEIRAFVGASIGPQRENAYLVKDLNAGTTLYYEPHGFYADELKDYAPIDVVINPVINLELPLVGPIIRGHQSALELAQQLRPQVLLPTAVGGDVEYEGLLNSMLKTVGSVEELRDRLKQQNLATQVMVPQTGQPLEVPAALSVS